ncbi:MAG TPA: ABC transporter ATP-binding protein [Deferrisomatales bacterium]|nr:ABC transporter ATP-binding protein [Deferrisomatales bacterium]
MILPSVAAPPVLQAVELWKSYGGAGGAASEALRGASLEVRPGEVVALYGRSGSGKTTLLNLLAGLDRPDRGTVAVEGDDLAALGERGRTRYRRTRLGFVFQFFNLLPTLTAFENVFLSLELAGHPDRIRVERTLEQVGLYGLGRRYPHELSGGEQQRVAIARALVKQPALILADEPTGNLDSRTGDAVLDLLAEQTRALDCALVMATHSPRTSRVADRVLYMVDGVVRADGEHTAPPLGQAD